MRPREEREKQPICRSPNDCLGTILESYDFWEEGTLAQLKAIRKSPIDPHHRRSSRPHRQNKRRRAAGAAFKSMHVSLLKICLTSQALHSGTPSPAIVPAFRRCHTVTCRRLGGALPVYKASTQ